MRMMRTRYRDVLGVALVATALAVPAAIAEEAAPASLKQDVVKALKNSKKAKKKASNANRKAKNALAVAEETSKQPGPAGPPGAAGEPGTASAYAAVLPDPGPVDVPPVPEFDAARTSGFTAVTRVFAGGYCLTPAAGIDQASRPAVASAEFGESGGLGAYVAIVENVVTDCPPGDYHVITYGEVDQPDRDYDNEDGIAFNIIVP